MLEYGNPSLNMDEAGYYLTVLNMAADLLRDSTMINLTTLPRECTCKERVLRVMIDQYGIT